MSSTMGPPWIKQAVLDLLRPLENPNGATKSTQFLHRQHVVQIVDANEPLRALLVSDKEVVVGVLLTAECFNRLCRDKPFRELKNSLIRLEKGRYHLTGVFSAAGDRDHNLLGKWVTLPMALQCDKCSLYGRSSTVTASPVCAFVSSTFLTPLSPHPIGDADLHLVGDSIVKLNQHAEVSQVLRTLKYIDMVRRLSARQFPNQGGHLPDSEGRFAQPPPFSSSNPLLPRHTVISARQAHILDKIDTYDRVAILEKQRAAVAQVEAMAAEDIVGNSGVRLSQKQAQQSSSSNAGAAAGRKKPTTASAVDALWDTGTQREEEDSGDVPAATQPFRGPGWGATWGARGGVAGLSPHTQPLHTQGDMGFTQNTQWMSQPLVESQSPSLPRGSGAGVTAAATAAAAVSGQVKSSSKIGGSEEQPLLHTQAGIPLSPIAAGDENELDDGIELVGAGGASAKVGGPKGHATVLPRLDADNAGNAAWGFMSKEGLELMTAFLPPPQGAAQAAARSQGSPSPARAQRIGGVAELLESPPSDPNAMIGRKLRKHFPDHGWYDGHVTSWRMASDEKFPDDDAEEPLFNIYFAKDNDEEELYWHEMVEWLIPLDTASWPAPVPAPRPKSADKSAHKRERQLPADNAADDRGGDNGGDNGGSLGRLSAVVAATAAVAAGGGSPKRAKVNQGQAQAQQAQAQGLPQSYLSSVIDQLMRCEGGKLRTVGRDADGLIIVSLRLFLASPRRPRGTFADPSLPPSYLLPFLLCCTEP